MKKIFNIGLSLLFWSTSGWAQEVDLAKGLLAFYPFTSDLTSQVPGMPSAVLKGAEFTENRFGGSETAVLFDGVEDEMLIPNSEQLQLSNYGEFSISLWIKPRDSNSGCIMLKEKDFGIRWNGLRKPISAFNGLKGGFPEGKFDEWSSSDWYHLALVRTQTNLILYINGEVDQTWKIPINEESSNKGIFIGKHPYFWGAFSGRIDDVAFYQRALNEYEIVVLTQLEHIPVSSFTEVEELSKVDLNSFLGNWQGVITQPGNEFVENFPFWLSLKLENQDKIGGYSRLEVTDDASYGVAKIQGFISGNALNIEEMQVIRQKNYLGYKWCRKYGQLLFDSKEDAIRGKWYADNCEQGGEIYLRRTDSRFNFFDNRLSEKISVAGLLEKLAKEDPEEVLREKILQLDLKPIFFATATSTLAEDSKSYLANELFPLLDQYPQLLLQIVGYTDNRGNDEVNLVLSLDRAKSIFDYLEEMGIEDSRITYLGLGEASPIADNSTEEGRKANRRVEFSISLE